METKYPMDPNDVLNDVYYRHISLLDAEKRNTVEMVEFMKNIMIPLMKKKDILFNSIFDRCYHGGSYINCVRTGNKNECSLYIVLKLPLPDDSCIKFIDNRCDAGFSICSLQGDIYHVVNSKFAKEEVNQLKKNLLLDPETESGQFEKDLLKLSIKGPQGLILSPGRTKAWVYRILREVSTDKELTQTFRQNNIKSINLNASGPALTIESTLTSGKKTSVDVMPAFAFKCERIFHLNVVGKELKTYWTTDQQDSYPEFGELTRYDDFLIYETGIPKKSLKYSKNRFQWRLDLIDTENRMIYQNGCAKMVVELLEYFRDSNKEIHGLPNYALRTVILLFIQEYTSFTWKEEHLSMYFLFALIKLHEGLRKRHLPFYFHPKSNIFDSISTPLAYKMQCWLGTVIKKLKPLDDSKKCGNNWKEHFKITKPDFVQTPLH